MIPLSILIPSIPSRFDKAVQLYQNIEQQCEGLDVEIIILTDNKRRTIGEKRNDLKNLSQGRFFLIVDDDDELLNVPLIYKAIEEHPHVDVITFKSLCRNDDGSTYVVTMQLGNEVEHNTEDGRYLDCKRPPFQMCAWHNRFKDVNYPFLNYGEDGKWVERALKKANSSYHIDAICHKYNFDSKISEATV